MEGMLKVKAGSREQRVKSRLHVKKYDSFLPAE
jgi:hypothetical protein